MINARRIPPATIVLTVALATASVAGFAGPRNGEGDKAFRGHERVQRQERAATRTQASASRPDRGNANRGAPRQPFAPSEGPRPAFTPARPVQQSFVQPPIRHDRTPGVSQVREGWRNAQPIGPRQAVERQDWGNRDRDRDRRNWGRGDWNPGTLGRHGRDRGAFQAQRWYPSRGFVVDRLPAHYRPIYHHHERLFFDDGIWYRPFGQRFVVVAPPIGVVVPLLPALYATFWIGGVPYYYANDAYYRWSDADEGYLVVERPANLDEEPSASIGEDIYIYPRNNQTEDEQSTDRYECHRWSVEQTGYDPSQPGEYGRGGEPVERRANYRRAMQACLSARGYSVT